MKNKSFPYICNFFLLLLIVFMVVQRCSKKKTKVISSAIEKQEVVSKKKVQKIDKITSQTNLSNNLTKKLNKVVQATETNIPIDNLVKLEVIICCKNRKPLEGEVFVRTVDPLGAYPKQELKKSLSGNNIFQFNRIYPNDCYIYVKAKGYFGVSTNFSLVEYGGAELSVEIQLQTVRPLFGKTIDAFTEEPVAGVAVAAYKIENCETFTDGGGKFMLEGFSESMVRLLVSHENYPTQKFGITVPKENEPDVVLKLKKPTHIFGYVTDEKNEKIPNCKIFVSDWSIFDVKIKIWNVRNKEPTTTTDEKGYFEFEMMNPMKNSATFVAESFEGKGFAEKLIKPAQENQVNIIISNKFSWLLVKAKENNGKPIKKIKVAASEKLNDLYIHFGRKGESSDGSYLFSHCRQCNLTDFTINSEGFIPFFMSNVCLKSSCTTMVEVTMSPFPATTEILGCVKRANGKPFSNRRVCLNSIENKAFKVTTKTDLYGEFVFSSVLPNYHYKFDTLNDVIIDKPQGLITTGNYINVTLKPYSEIRLLALVTNSNQRIIEFIYNFSPNPFSHNYPCFSFARLYNDSAHYNILPGMGNYTMLLKADGYKPISINRTFNSDEDVDLGTIYFTPQNKTQ